MKISIKLEGYLKYKYPTNILERNYSKSVTTQNQRSFSLKNYPQSIDTKKSPQVLDNFK